MAEAVDFEVAVLREDLVMPEAFDELVLPLSPTAEGHTRGHRTTLERRRVLFDLMVAADLMVVAGRMVAVQGHDR